MNRIEHHLLNMYVITTYLLRLRKHQYLKRSISFCVKVRRNHRMNVNHLPFLQNSKKCFGTRSIDKFSFRISTRRIILVVEGRECDKQIYYFKAIRVGTESYRSWILYVIVLQWQNGNLFESIFLIAFCFCKKCDKEFNFLV